MASHSASIAAVIERAELLKRFLLISTGIFQAIFSVIECLEFSISYSYKKSHKNVIYQCVSIESWNLERQTLLQYYSICWIGQVDSLVFTRICDVLFELTNFWEFFVSCSCKKIADTAIDQGFMRTWKRETLSSTGCGPSRTRSDVKNLARRLNCLALAIFAMSNGFLWIFHIMLL